MPPYWVNSASRRMHVEEAVEATACRGSKTTKQTNNICAGHVDRSQIRGKFAAHRSTVDQVHAADREAIGLEVHAVQLVQSQYINQGRG